MVTTKNPDPHPTRLESHKTFPPKPSSTAMEDSATSVPPSTWASLNSWFTSTVVFLLLNIMIATIVFTSNLPNNNQNHHQEEEEEHHQRQKQNPQPQIARSPSILHRLKSFNFYPHRSQPEFSPEIHRHHEPLEEAATQYVFNQPLHYQHFDFDTTIYDRITAAGDRFSAFNQTHQPRDTETRVVWEEHVQPVEAMMTHFDFDPTHEQNQRDTGFKEGHADEFQSLDEVYSKLKGKRVDGPKFDGELPHKPPAKMKKSASLKVGFSHLEDEDIVEARRPATVRDKRSAFSAREDDDDVEVDAKADDFINKFKNDLKLQRIESIIRTKGATSRGTAV